MIVSLICISSVVAADLNNDGVDINDLDDDFGEALQIDDACNNVTTQETVVSDENEFDDVLSCGDGESLLSAESNPTLEDSSSDDANHFGYWVWSSSMYEINFTDLANHGVTDLFLNSYAYEKYGQTALEDWIGDANDEGIHIHLWKNIFYDGTWHRPIINGTVNYEYFDEMIETLVKYANITGLYGIHYDYMRFSGSEKYNNTGYQNPGGEEAISYFANESIKAIRAVNPNLVISNALMPEPDNLERLYANNYSVLSELFDVVVPMTFAGNYPQDSEWIAETTKWFVENSKGAEVWSGLQGYSATDYNETIIFKMPLSQVNSDIQSVLDENASGAIIFRYNITHDIDFNNLTVDEEELSSFSYLNYLISSGKVPTELKRDITFSEKYDADFVDGILILKNDLIIDGGNHIVDAKEMASILNIAGNNVTLMNFRFINAYGDRGGAIYISGNDTKIINCTFINSFATIEAGAIYLKAARGQIINSTFINSTSLEYTGAVLVNSENATVIGSYFENNRANISAGALGWARKDNGILKDCVFVNNAAYFEGGGALFWNRGNNGIIQNNTFIGNFAQYEGAAIFWNYGDNGLISDCTFINNNATRDGGAIYNNGTNKTISNSIFINNVAGRYGGAICSADGLDIFNCSFDNNIAEDRGGAMYFTNAFTNSTISNSNFTNNFAVDGAGIYLGDICENVKFYNLNFVNNTGDNGVGINLGQVQGTEFNKINFINNSARSSGGAIFVRGEISDSVFSEINLINNSARVAAGFSFREIALKNKFTKINAIDNSVKYQGGVFFFLTNSESNAFDEINFINNSAEGVGAALYSTLIWAYNNFTNCNFENNKAGKDGGALVFYSDVGKSVFDNCNFVNNTAGLDGGAIYFNMDLIDSVISNSYFINNFAQNGAGIFVQGNCEYDVFIGLNFANNNVNNTEGVSDIYLGMNSNVIVQNSVFGDKNNIYVANGSISLINNTENNFYEKSYFVLNNGIMVLENNSLTNAIVNKGEILTKTSIYVLNNDTINVTRPDVVLVAYCMDDNGNYVVSDNMIFDINGDKITVPMNYDIIGFADYNLTDLGVYLVNATLSSNLSDCSYNTGIIQYLSKDPQMNVSDINITPDEYPEILVTIDSNATGMVIVNLNNRTIITPVENGTALVILPKLEPGDYTANVSYAGDSIYAPQDAEANIHVKSVTIDASDMVRGWNSGYDYQAKLLDENGTPIADKLVEFTISGKQYYAFTNSNGIASIKPKLNVGEYSVIVSSPLTNQTVTKTAKIVKRITNNKYLNVYYDSNKKYKVKIIGDDGKAESKGKSVNVYVDGKKTTYKTDKNGFITITLNKNFKVGTHIIKIQYKGYTVQNKLTVKHLLKSNDIVTVKKSAKKVVLTAKLDKNHKNKVIKFKINGKIYKAKTNSKGIAKLSINKNKLKKTVNPVTITYLKDTIKTNVVRL